MSMQTITMMSALMTGYSVSNDSMFMVPMIPQVLETLTKAMVNTTVPMYALRTIASAVNYVHMSTSPRVSANACRCTIVHKGTHRAHCAHPCACMQCAQSPHVHASAHTVPHVCSVNNGRSVGRCWFSWYHDDDY